MTFTTSVHTVFPQHLAQSWDALAIEATNFFMSSKWIEYISRDVGVTTVYCAVVDPRGALVGALPVSHAPDDDHEMYCPAKVFPGMRGNWTSAVYQVGARRGYTNDILVSADLSAGDTVGVIAAAVAAAREWIGHDGGIPAIAWHLGAEQAATLQDRLAASPPMVSCYLAEIVLEGTSLTDYLGGLTQHRANTVRREIHAAERAGLAFATEPLDELAEEAGPLIAQTMTKYGSAWDSGRGIASLQRQSRRFGDNAIAFTCRRNGALLGITVGYRWGVDLVLRSVGFDYPVLIGAFEYFNLCYYTPIRYGYEHGVRRILLGDGALDAKCRRGARLTPRWTSVLPGEAGPSAETAADWNRRSFESLPPVCDSTRLADEAACHGFVPGSLRG